MLEQPVLPGREERRKRVPRRRSPSTAECPFFTRGCRATSVEQLAEEADISGGSTGRRAIGEGYLRFGREAIARSIAATREAER